MGGPVQPRRAVTAGAMYKVLILFGPPVDKAAFGRYFEETHRPMLDSLPQSESVEVNWSPVKNPCGWIFTLFEA